jgi:hypothetical protein
MKKKKINLMSGGKNIWSNNQVNINKEESEYFFEIGTELTNDVAEAVAIMMRKVDWNSPVWDLEINDVVSENIGPEKSLYWLTGGKNEWINLEHYKKPWSEYYLDFQEEFGIIIVSIIKKSKNLKEIRDKFNKYLNLPILYDFALSKNMIK